MGDLSWMWIGLCPLNEVGAGEKVRGLQSGGAFKSDHW
jgi:hypothetical protein